MQAWNCISCCSSEAGKPGSYCPRMEKNASEPVKRGKGIQCKLRSWFEANTWEGKHAKVPCMWIKREGKQLKNDQEDSCMAIEEAASLIAQVSS